MYCNCYTLLLGTLQLSNLPCLTGCPTYVLPTYACLILQLYYSCVILLRSRDICILHVTAAFLFSYFTPMPRPEQKIAYASCVCTAYVYKLNHQLNPRGPMDFIGTHLKPSPFAAPPPRMKPPVEHCTSVRPEAAPHIIKGIFLEHSSKPTQHNQVYWLWKMGRESWLFNH